MGLKILLEKKHLNTVELRNKALVLAKLFEQSYKTISIWVSDNIVNVELKFNGVCKINISENNGNLVLRVHCFGFRDHKDAILIPFPGCSDVGMIEYKDTQVADIVNDLAEYEKIFPIF